MSTQKRPKAKLHLIDWAWKRVNVLTKGLMTWLLRGLFVIQRPARFSRAGFVLPTVVMVSLVVTLLTVAVMVRSFDRAQSASNYRVNQEVLNASLPALDRARAKIIALLADNRLGTRGTPSEIAIDDVLRLPKFNLGDEARLKIIDDIDGDGTPGEDRSEVTEGFVDEELTTNAWRFPVDTDNNGLFDSFTLYSILFRTPNVNAAGNGFERPRSPLEARALPLDQGVVSGRCAAASGTSASLVGNAGWFLSDGQIKKSFFVYVSTVPITNLDATELGLSSTDDYEVNRRGGRAFSAIEYQQDQARIPLSNNAVLYEDDLDIASGPPLRINGRVFTNSNLFLTEFSGSDQGPLEFYQVSSPESCFYEPENAKIVVGGNVTYGTIEDSGQDDGKDVPIHLYVGAGVEPRQDVSWDDGNDSVEENSSRAGYNTQAYEERIAELARLAKDAITNSNDDPQGVKNIVEQLTNRPVNPLEEDEARDRAYDRYFRERTRRVPYNEVPQEGPPNPLDYGGGSITLGDLEGLGFGGNNDELRPPEEWIYPFETTNNFDGTNFSELSLNLDGADQLEPAATQFETLAADEVENHLGDRVLIGNNLPELDLSDIGWVGDIEFTQLINRDESTPINWNTPDEPTRERQTRVATLDDLGDISRDGFWETEAATTPENPLIPEGGLRIVTGAGVYLPSDPSLGTAAAVESSPNVVIWPDTMPVIPNAFDQATPPLPDWLDAFPTYESGGTSPERPFLRMRASAVYHYRDTDDTPIACVDNYYDPTNSITASRPDNGKVYNPPTASATGYLNYLANQVYPNGRTVNQLLRDALYDEATGAPRPVGNRTLAQQSAVDAAICGLQIFDTLTTGGLGIGTLSPGAQGGYELQDSVIKEIAFLDPRQIKAIDAKNVSPPSPADVNVDALPENDIHGASTNELNSEYKLPIEQREPLEVRATVIDIERLRVVDPSNPSSALNGAGPTTPTVEYMLPNSGIIYATRNDALTDRSELGQPTEAANERVSANDFMLDPTRRPSAIMLENGETLGRRTTYEEIEKGLTLVSNLPVYVKGEFNPHENGTGALEEFIQTLNINDYGNFYDRTDLNDNFACRRNDPRLPCPDGDQWRVANILSDALTLLSEGFRPGVRIDGDFDLRNNQTDNVNEDISPEDDIDDSLGISTADSIREKRIANGFLNNDFAVNGLSSGATVADPDGDPLTSDEKTPIDTDYSTTNVAGEYLGSSYFNNFVTPVQRRVIFPEYVMEICRKLPVSDCEPDDWVVGYDIVDDAGQQIGDGDLEDIVPGFGDTEANIRANQLADVLANLPNDALTTPFNAFASNQFNPNLLGAGTTTRPALIEADRRYARRVAFLRWNTDISVSNGGSIIPNPGTEDLVLDGGTPIPLGIAGNDCDIATTCVTDLDSADGTLEYYPYLEDLNIDTDLGGVAGPHLSNKWDYSSGDKPRLRGNTLWYRTLDGANNLATADENYGYEYPLDYVNREGGSAAFNEYDLVTGTAPEKHPLLVPVLNIQYPAWPVSGATSPDPGEDVEESDLEAPDDQAPKGSETNWLQPAQLTPDKDAVTFNIVMATGDVPGRPTIPFADPLTNGEFNGGLANLPRFIERWTDEDGDEIRTNISGSLIQLKRSSYATAPYFQLPYRRNIPIPGGPFGYPQTYTHERTSGRSPYFVPPGRNWGFDVGLLSQIPDLLAQRFTLQPVSNPREFFREISRNDDWLQPLLCAKPLDPSDPTGVVTSGDAINSDQRPDDCPSAP